MKGRNNNKRRAASKLRAKPQPEAILCAVCGKGDGKYKCPKCRAPFCCVQCSKEHRANICPASKGATTTESADNAAAAAAAAAINNGVANERSQYLSQKELKADDGDDRPKKRKRARGTEGNDDDDHDDEPGWNVTPEMRERVLRCEWLRKELQDGGLRQLIERIDAASDEEEEEDDDDKGGNNRRNANRGGNWKRNDNGGAKAIPPRELALARARHSRPKFASFVDRMLLTAGVLRPTIESVLGDGNGDGPLVLAPVPRRSGATDDADAREESESDSGSDDGDSSSSDSDDDSDDGDSSESSEGSDGSG